MNGLRRQMQLRLFAHGSVDRHLNEAGTAWRSGRVIREVDPNAEVLFLIPLKGIADAEDWERVERNLALTLVSLQEQSNARWRAIICSQDKPSFDLDPRVSFLAHPNSVEPGVSDKPAKLEQLYAHLGNLGSFDGYAFALDADDIIRRDVVSHFLEERSRHGYVISRGYIYDVRNDILGRLQPKSFVHPLTTRFWRLCGSCCAIRIDLRGDSRDIDLLRIRGKHTEQLGRLAAYGVHLDEVRFHAAMYLSNHGDNISERKGRREFQIAYARRNRLRGSADRRVREEFHVSRVRETLASLGGR